MKVIFQFLSISICCIFLGCTQRQADIQHTHFKNHPSDEQFPFAQTITYKQQEFDVFAIRLDQANIQMHLHDPQGQKFRNFKTLKDFFQQQGQQLRFATNAGIFNPDRMPTGLYIEEGQTIKSLNLEKKKGNFYLKPNGVFALTDDAAYVLKSEVYAQQQLSTNYATQSGPILVYDDTLHPAFNANSPNKYIRSGVGVRNEKEIFFAISKTPVNFYDFAMLFKEKLACPDALYLDGAISKMYLPELDRMDSTGNFSVMISVYHE